MRRHAWPWCVAVAVAVAACARASPGAASGLAAADQLAIRRLDSAFVRGWLDDDTAHVLSVFDTSAVLLPPNTAPVRGLGAIRSYWWPTDGSHTRITAFTRSIEEIVGDGALAYTRGVSTLAWTYEKGGAPQSQSSRSVDLIIYGRDAHGAWRVLRQMWTAVP